jgi:hypothetical protein
MTTMYGLIGLLEEGRGDDIVSRPAQRGLFPYPPTYPRFEEALLDWLDRYNTEFWKEAAEAYVAGTGRSDFLAYVLGILSKPLYAGQRVNLDQVQDFAHIAERQLLCGNRNYLWTPIADINPVDAWLTLSTTLPSEHLWLIFMYQYVLLEKEGDIHYISLTTQDAMTEEEATPFRLATRNFLETYRFVKFQLNIPY